MSAAARLPTALEVAALIRAVEAGGGQATVLRKGDGERGALVLVIASRGQVVALYERILGGDGDYAWREAVGGAAAADSRKVADFLAKRARFDADFWALELDIADPQRFIAENLGKG